MTAIELRGVQKQYPGFRLGPIDFTIPQGFVTGFVGANGAGKTTTIKIMLGMVHQDAGTVLRPGRAEIGIVLDTPCYESEWRVAAVGRALRPFYPRWSDTAFADLLDRFDVPSDKKVKELSRGMGMKLQIAAALARDAKTLILDEPTSGLDPVSRDELATILSEYMTADDRTVLFSSHITADLERIADYVAVIDKGQLITVTEREQLIDSYRIVRGGHAPGAVLTAGAFGLRQHAAGWDALIPSDLVGEVPGDAIIEPPSLDDIVIRIAKGH